MPIKTKDRVRVTIEIVGWVDPSAALDAAQEVAQDLAELLDLPPSAVDEDATTAEAISI